MIILIKYTTYYYSINYYVPVFNGLTLEEINPSAFVATPESLIPQCQHLLHSIPYADILPVQKTLTTLKQVVNDGNTHFAYSMLSMDSEYIRQRLSIVHYPRLFNLDTCYRYTREFGVDKSTPDYESRVDVICFNSTLSDDRKYSPIVTDRIVHFYYESPFVTCSKNVLISDLGNMHRSDITLQLEGGCNNLNYGGEDINAPFYEQVFILNLYWGGEFYHSMAEVMPRVSYYYDYLLGHPEIKIQIADGFPMKLFQFLGFPRDQLISGPVKAGMAYTPETPHYCGNPYALGLLRIREIIQGRLKVVFGDDLESTRKSILIIKRTGSRRLREHDQMVERLRKEYPGVQVRVYADKDDLKVAEIFKLFYQANVVIAPHGAGLANLVASKQGTVVVEFLSNEINYCFTAHSVILGMKYFGTIADPGSNSKQIIGSIDDAVDIIAKFGNLD